MLCGKVKLIRRKTMVIMIKHLIHFYLKKFKPLEYARKIGVNFPWGGYTSMEILTGVLSRG